MKIFYAVFFFLFTVVSILAQAPEQISYQAVVRGSDNAIVANQAVGMRISVLQGGTLASPGSVAYSETQTTTTNANGLLSIYIGAGTAVTGVFSQIDWSALPHYIKIEIDPTGNNANYTITGTTQLVSVPFALYAKTAGSSQANATNISKNTADIATNVTAIAANTDKVVITRDQSDAITANTAKEGYTEELVSANSVVTANKTNIANETIRVTEQAALISSLQEQIAAVITAFGPPWPRVTIGSQIWQSTNLDVVTYRDGTVIPEVNMDANWTTLKTGAWCYYANESENGTTYGKMYNWYAVAGIYNTASLNDPSLRKSLTPIGWHIPSKTEWETLIASLGGESYAGSKMKESGTTHWVSPNTNANNSSGFTALPGGETFNRFGNQEFQNITEKGNWWSASVWGNDDQYAWGLILSSGSGTEVINRLSHSAMSVRCIKD
jgi:uncharacterized protein (TIGR02145 family)